MSRKTEACVEVNFENHDQAFIPPAGNQCAHVAGDDFGAGVGGERHDSVSGLTQDGTSLFTPQDSLKKKM